MKIHRDDLEDFITGASAPYKVLHEEIVDQSRWDTTFRIIFLDTTTGDFFDFYYSKGSTEMQEDGIEINMDFDEEGYTELEPLKLIFETVMRFV